MKTHPEEKGPINITDTLSLQSEIFKVRERIKTREIELKTMTEKLPPEVIKYTAALVLPGFFTTKVASASIAGVWNIVKLATGQKKAIFPLITSLVKTILLVFVKNKLKTIGVNNANHKK